jgi:hypothetical protein
MAVILAKPCIAQEVEPEGLFSIEGTRWGICVIGFITLPPFFSMWCPAEVTFGFDKGTVYRCNQEVECEAYSDCSYIDSPVVSIAYAFTYMLPFPCDFAGELAIMQPGGFGVYTQVNFIFGLGFSSLLGIMFKVDDNWTPPEVG